MQRFSYKIYRSRLHVAVTLAFLAAPFVFLLAFSQIAHVATATLFGDVFVSTLRLALAYGIAAVLGWTFAILFFRGRRAVIALPFFDVLQSFPTFALLPVITLAWGASTLTVVFFLVITVIWPIFFSVISSLKLVRRDWQEAVEIARPTPFHYLRYFLLPASAPGFIMGSIIGLGDGWEALIATEIIIHIKTGLGSFFQVFSQNSWITAFGILGVLLLIFSINKLVWLPLLEWSHGMTEE